MPRLSATLRLASAVAGLAVCLMVSPLRAAAPDEALQLLEVEINGQNQDKIVTASGEGDSLALLASDAADLRLDVSAAPSIIKDDAQFVVLSGVPGLKAHVDQARQLLVLDAQPQAFVGTHIGAGPASRVRVTSPETSAFVNYDLLGEADSGTSARTLGGTVETGTSGSFGFADNTMTVAASGHAVTRLDTTYRDDLPDTMDSLDVGDSISRTSSSGTPLRFVGVQYGRDFSLQPGFIAFPTATLQGSANLPSTVQVYVNNALRYQSDVPPGPFSIDQLPTVNGAGQTSVVVRDPLGRETVTQASFYTSSALLHEGLWDYSYSAGLQRENYGEQSFNYRTPFASSLVRYGVSDGMTAEMELDGSGPAQVEATDLVFAVPIVGQAEIGVAESQGVSHASGTQLHAGISRIGPTLSFSADIRHSIGGFTQFGDQSMTDRGLNQADVSAGVSFGSAGSLTMGFTELQRAEMPLTNVTTLTYGVQVAQAGFITLAVSSIAQARRTTTTSLTFTMPLGGASIASASVESRPGGVTASQNYSYQPENQRGLGGSLTVGEGRFATDDARLTWDDNQGSELAEVSHTATGTGARLGAAGGFAFIGDDVFASRKLDDSYALVSVKDYPDVRVYRDNTEVAQTDAQGNALISGLQPYEANRLALDIADIPVSTSLTGESIEVVPGRRSGVMAAFDVKSAKGLTVILKRPDGSFVPAGATVAAEGMDQPAFAGFDGVVYLLGATENKPLRVVWPDHECRAMLPHNPATNDDPVTLLCADVGVK
jgi:outer membrane usher protein